MGRIIPGEIGDSRTEIYVGRNQPIVKLDAFIPRLKRVASLGSKRLAGMMQSKTLSIPQIAISEISRVTR